MRLRKSSGLHTRKYLTTALLVFSALIASEHSFAGVITVGRSGIAGNCTEPTIQEAIGRAVRLGGHNVIWVTRDVAGGVWHENLEIEDVPDNLQLDIVGGFESCTSTTPSGKTTILGDADDKAVFFIRGKVDVRLSGLSLEQGGTNDDAPYAGGIEFEGRGRLALTNTVVTNNRGANINFEGTGGEAKLDLLGDVVVSSSIFLASNASAGIQMTGTSVLTMRGHNSISRNGGDGLLIFSPAVADIGGSGEVIHDNKRAGIQIYANATNSGRTTRLFSTDPADPLTLARNLKGAILFTALQSPYWLCTRNISIRNNLFTGNPLDDYGSLIRIDGAPAHLLMNTGCEFPPEADISCPGPLNGGTCNAISDNRTEEGKALISAVNGGTVAFDRLSILSNTASSVLSTNLGTQAADSQIFASNSLIAGNVLRDNVIEALQGSTVKAVSMTIADNTGSLSPTLLAVAPRRLDVWDSVIAQDQILLDVPGGSSLVLISNVLAPNDFGTGPFDIVTRGTPDFIENTYRLTPGALGIDHAFSVEGVDIDGNPRTVDTEGVENTYGPQDLGAYESQVPVFNEDRIFRDGFEAVL